MYPGEPSHQERPRFQSWNCILLDATSGEFTLIGNDLDMGIKTVLEANTKEQGTIAVNAKIFNEIIRKLPDRRCIHRDGRAK